MVLKCRANVVVYLYNMMTRILPLTTSKAFITRY